VIDTFFAFRSFLVEEQNFQLPLSVRSLLTWRARVKRNPLITVMIRVAGLSWALKEHYFPSIFFLFFFFGGVLIFVITKTEMGLYS